MGADVAARRGPSFVGMTKKQEAASLRDGYILNFNA
jgi:hypothetical protein